MVFLWFLGEADNVSFLINSNSFGNLLNYPSNGVYALRNVPTTIFGNFILFLGFSYLFNVNVKPLLLYYNCYCCGYLYYYYYYYYMGCGSLKKPVLFSVFGDCCWSFMFYGYLFIRNFFVFSNGFYYYYYSCFISSFILLYYGDDYYVTYESSKNNFESFCDYGASVVILLCC